MRKLLRRGYSELGGRAAQLVQQAKDDAKALEDEKVPNRDLCVFIGEGSYIIPSREE